MQEKNFLLSSTEGYFGEGRYNASNKYPLYNREKYIKDYKYLYRKTSFIKNNKLPEVWNSEFTNVWNCFITSRNADQLDSNFDEVHTLGSKFGLQSARNNIKTYVYGKTFFASSEEKEIIKNVLNSNWKLIPGSIVEQLKTIAPDNYYGQIIKLLMITSNINLI